MKMTFYLALICLFINTSMKAQTSTDAIKTVATEFIKATDVQDADRLAKTLHNESMQYVLFGPKVLTISRKDYMSQLEARQVGGLPRAIEFGKAHFAADGIATLALTATSSKLKFHYQINFLKVEGKWLISAVNTQVDRL